MDEKVTVIPDNFLLFWSIGYIRYANFKNSYLLDFTPKNFKTSGVEIRHPKVFNEDIIMSIKILHTEL